MGKLKDLIGQKFGKLTVISRAPNMIGSTGYSKVRWNCKCECGNQVAIETVNLRRARTKGCGCGRRQRIPNELRNLRRHFKNYRGGAKLRSIDFELEFEDFCRLVKARCHYCNEEPSPKANRDYVGEMRLNGIDRVDSGQGYKLSNAVTCCALCNRMKYKMTSSQFWDHVSKLYNQGLSLNVVRKIQSD